MRSWLFASLLILQIVTRANAYASPILASAPNAPAATTSAPQSHSWNDIIEVGGKRQPRWQVWLQVIGLSCAIPLVLLVILFAWWRLHLRVTSPISRMTSDEIWSHIKDQEGRL